eukprot:m51a1_g11871 putative rho gtpase (194) ;mRNA; f:541131-542034
MAETEHIKLVVVGDSSIGKTCLLLSFAKGVFPEDHVPTVFDNYSTAQNRGGTNVSLELIDTAGQEDYDRLRPLSYANADVLLVCFSTADRESLDHVESKWVTEVRHFCPDVPFILVGLKTDLRDSVSDGVGTETAEQVAMRSGAAFYREASARTRAGLEDTFYAAIDAVLDMRRGAARKARNSAPRKQKCAVM